jgi:acetolactate synthase-1/2/3 large subunit
MKTARSIIIMPLTQLDRVLPQDRVLATDGGRFVRGAWSVISTMGPDAFVPALDFGSIGLGFSYGLGAACAAKGRPVVVIAGDGAFMNGGLAEFNTAVRTGLDMIVVIGNDSSYGAEHHKFASKQRDPIESMFDWPDFAPVAIALGGEGITVRSNADWALVEEAVANRKAPLLIDVKLDAARLTAED